MPVTARRARELALEFPDASEKPHFHRTAFRTPRKTFATLDPAVPDLNLMFSPDLQEHWCALAPEALAPVPGGWGRLGATRCDLTRVREDILRGALEAAHALAQPAPRRRK